LDHHTILKIYRIGEATVFFGDKPVPLTHSLESLGVEIYENLSWEKHIDKICKKASAGIGAIKLNALNRTLILIHYKPYIKQ
jgi:hypothetical protein